MAAFQTTRPAPTVHRRCGAVILSGLAEGIPTRVDITVLPQELLILAILRRTRLYWLDPIGLAYIDRHRMRSAGRNSYPVLPQHLCGIQWPHEAIVQILPQTDDAIPY